MDNHARKSEVDRLDPPPNTLGLHQVYPDPTSQGNLTATVDIVAVHGLGGDSYSTFTRDKCLWIRDLLPSASYFENARIMTYGYDARAFLHPFARSTNGRTLTFAEALLNDLADKRVSGASKNRPVIFMGHSLGGIVIKSALNYAHARYGLYGSILDSTKAVVFFGTPHQGADTAVWATFLGNVGKAVRLRNTEVVEELKRWSNPLVDLTRTFSELAPRFSVSTYFEKKTTNGILIVPEGTAIMGQQNERIRGLEADHHDVCKFTEKDPNWNVVKGRLEAIMAEIQEGLALPAAPLGNPLQERMQALPRIWDG